MYMYLGIPGYLNREGVYSSVHYLVVLSGIPGYLNREGGIQ